jgi:hypothetical protein
MAHSDRVREYKLTDQGLQVLDGEPELHGGNKAVAGA